MKDKLVFIELMFKDLLKNAKIYADNKATYEKEWKQYRDGKVCCRPSDWNYMDKNHGKVAIQRKITYLRQELLNLERMLDE